MATKNPSINNWNTVTISSGSTGVDKTIDEAINKMQKKISQKNTSSMQDVYEDVADITRQVDDAEGTLKKPFTKGSVGVIPAVGDKSEYETLGELVSAINDNPGTYTIVVGDDFNFGGATYTINSASEVVLDVNNHDINLYDNESLVVKGGGKLTVTGKGSLNRVVGSTKPTLHATLTVSDKGSVLNVECPVTNEDGAPTIVANSGTELNITNTSVTQTCEDARYSNLQVAGATVNIINSVISGLYPNNSTVNADGCTFTDIVETNGSNAPSEINISNSSFSYTGFACYFPSKTGNPNTVNLTNVNVSGYGGILNIGSNLTIDGDSIISTKAQKGELNGCGDANFGKDKQRIYYPAVALINSIMNTGYNNTGVLTIKNGTFIAKDTPVLNVLVNNGTSGDGSLTTTSDYFDLEQGLFSLPLDKELVSEHNVEKKNGKYYYSKKASSVVVAAGTESTYGFPASTFGSIKVKGNSIVGQLKKAENITANFPPEKQNGYYIYLNAEPWEGTEVRRKMNGEWGNFASLSENGKFLIFVGSEKVEVTDIDVKDKNGIITTYHVNVTTTE